MFSLSAVCAVSLGCNYHQEIGNPESILQSTLGTEGKQYLPNSRSDPDHATLPDSI